MTARRACQYCGNPESILRRRVGFVVCFDCAEEGGRHDQAVVGKAALADGPSRSIITLFGEGERVVFGDWFAVADGQIRVPPFAIPKRLKEMSLEQVEKTVVYLSGKRLKDLRRWQGIVVMQIEKINTDYAPREAAGYYDDAVENLQEMDRHLAAAVHLKEFPECL